MKEPRLSISEDGQHVYIGFAGTNDTILKVGGNPGPGGWRDVERTRQWVEEVQGILDATEARKGKA